MNNDNVTDINTARSVMDRPINDLNETDLHARAAVSIEALHIAMDNDDVEGALAALRGYSEQIDMESYIAVKSILQHHMRSCYRVCFAPSKGWYDAGDEFRD